MLHLAFSEYFFQTSSFAYYTAGAFSIAIEEEVSRMQRNGVRVARVIQDGALACQLSVRGSIKLLIGLWKPETVDQKHLGYCYALLLCSIQMPQAIARVRVPLSKVPNTGSFTTKKKGSVGLRHRLFWDGPRIYSGEFSSLSGCFLRDPYRLQVLQGPWKQSICQSTIAVAWSLADLASLSPGGSVSPKTYRLQPKL